MMTKKQRRLLYILIPVICVFILSIILIVLYIKTDFLKSDQDLFYKYMLQNAEIIEPILDEKNEREYIGTLQQNKINSNSELIMEYTTDVNTSNQNKDNAINQVKVALHEQIDTPNGKDYKNIQLLQNDEKLLQAEYIKETNLYGLRFPDIMGQFLSVRDENLKQIAKKYGLSDIAIEKIPDQIEKVDPTSFYFTDEEKQDLLDTYSNIIVGSIPETSYSRQKNVLITINGQDAQVNAYSVSISQEQLNNIYIKILEQVKQDDSILNKVSQLDKVLNYYKYLNIEKYIDEETLRTKAINYIDEVIEEIKNNNIGSNEIKFTVYESDQTTVRTTIESNTENITADMIWNGSKFNYIINKEIADERTNKETWNILKEDSVEIDSLSISITKEVDNDISTIEYTKTRQVVNNSIQTNRILALNDSVDSLTLKLAKEDKIVSDFEQSIVLDQTNNVTLNDLESDKLKEFVTLVRTQWNKHTTDKTKQLKDSLDKNPVKIFGFGEKNEIVIENTGDVSDLERNRFNARFEFYSGNEISLDNVKRLLEEVRNNLDSVQVISGDQIQLNISKGKKNDELANQILAIVEEKENNTFTVEIKYAPETKIIQSVLLTINE